MPGVVLADQRCEDKVPLDISTVTIGGVKGSYLPPASADRVAFVLTECVPSYQRLIAAQAKELGIQTAAVRTASAALDARRVQADEEHVRAELWKGEFTHEHTLRMEDESLSRSPVLWLAIGVVAGAAATIGIAYAYKKAVQ